MNKIFTLVLLCAILATKAYSQGCIPQIPATPGPSCPDAPFLCCGEVNGLSGTLPTGVNLNGPNPLCPGTGNVPNNIEWVSFAAGSTSITLQLTLTNCTNAGSGPGAQVGVWQSCGFTNAVYCNGAANTGVLVIPLNGLIIGDVYHLFIDGFGGSVCDYSFAVTAGNTFAPQPSTPPSITGALSVCEGIGAQQYFAGLGAASNFNEWSVSPASVPFNINASTEGITILDFSSAAGGTVDICVEGLNDCYQTPTGNTTCISVQVNQNPQVQISGEYCLQSGGYCPPEDPNGNCYPIGVHTFNVDDPASGLGCQIEYELTVTALLAEDLDSMIVLCPGETWTNVTTGQQYFAPSFGCQNLFLPYGNGFNGCPRSINLQLCPVDTSAQIQASPGTVLSCDVPNIILTANVDFDPVVTYYYEWDTQDGTIVGGTNGPNIIVNAAGTYTLQVTMETSDDRGLVICTSTPTQITITEDVVGPDVSDISQTPASCGSTANGTATVVPTGGVSPYTITWGTSPTQSGGTATGLLPGTYSVTVLDNTQCESITNITVDGTPVVTMDANPTVNNVDCFNAATGSATVSATGGTGTITYTWPGGATGATQTGLAAGTYSVTAEDALGCQDITSITITEPADAVTATVIGSTASACGQQTGSIDITPSGGTGSYTYLWSDPGASTDQDLTNAGAGSYEVTVFDANMCSYVLSGSIPNADGPSVDAIVVTPASCFGDADGSLDLQYSGGTGPYTITWDDAGIPLNTEDPSGLSAGTYNVTVMDNNMCETTGTATVTEPVVLTASATATTSNCGQATGDISLTVAGGSTVSTYVWDNGAPAVQNPQDQAAGTYNVTVTDINGCEALASVMITEPDNPVGTSTYSDITCFGLNNGSVSVNITTGGGGYGYTWSDPALTDANETGLAAGTYTVTVTDANNCTVEFTETVTEPPVITPTLAAVSTECFGEQNGSGTASAVGGSGSGYLFTWCSGEVTDTPAMLPAGTCSVTITDGAGCTVIEDVVVPEAPELLSSLVGVTDLACNDDGSGAIDLDVSGGTGTITYNWSDSGISSSTQDPTGLDAGTYEVTVEDANGCEVEILNIEIDEPDLLEIDFTTANSVCGQPNGSINVMLTGGSGSPTYTWSPDLGNTGTLNNSVAAGTYDLTVTDIMGCEAYETIVVNEPSPFILDAENDDVLDCNGADDGQVSVEVSGGSGSGTYDYNWVDGFPNSPTVSGLSAGVYDVEIEDANGCTVLAQVEVTEPPVIDATITPAATNCFGEATGSAIASASGGSGSGYSFTWCNSEVTDTPSQLPAGPCTVVVADGNGCTQSFDIVVPEAAELVTSLNGVANLSCFEDGTGSIDINATGGTGGLTFNWSDPAIGNTEDPTGLDAGMYSVTIVDDNGCDQEILAIDITEPQDVAIAFTTDNAVCGEPNGSIEVQATGGTVASDYTYTWSPDIGNTGTFTNAVASGTYNLTVTDDNGCQEFETIVVDEPNALVLANQVDDLLDCSGGSDGQVSVEPAGGSGAGTYTYTWADGFPDAPTATGLSVGTYDVEIEDANGCTIQATLAVTEPTPVAITLDNSVDPDCASPNGSISISVAGGTVTTGYTFDWNNGEFITEDISGLQSGTYQVIATDNNGCTSTETYSVQAPGIFNIEPVVDTDVTCFGLDNGTINVTLNGGTGPFSYNWSDPSIPDTESNPIDLPPGFYSAEITDLTTGCVSSFAPVEITEPAQIEFTGSAAVAASCLNNNGSIDATVLGGTGTPDYSWTGPNGFTAATEDISGLEAGDYTLVITDDNNCMGSLDIEVMIPTPPTLSTVPMDALCNGTGTGTIQAIPNNPNGTVSYTWSAPVGDVDLATGLTAGIYNVTITDSEDCTAEALGIVIDEPTPIDLQFTTTQAACGQQTGTIDLTASGGTVTNGYTYSWSGGLSPTEDQMAVGQGNYMVTVTDANGCTAEELIPVMEPASSVVVPTPTPVTCYGLSDGAIDLDVTGGNTTNGYTFQWSDSSIGNIEDPTGLSEGTYTVTVLDSDGCGTSETIVIDQPDEITVSAVTSPADCGMDVGAIDLTPSGGVGTFSFDWTNAALPDISNPTNLPAGSYEVVITDQTGCSITESFIVDNPNGVELAETWTDNPCFGDAQGTIQLNIQGIDPSMLTITWDDPSIPVGTENATGLAAGTYTGVIEDQAGCDTPFSIEITDPPAMAAMTQTNANVSCNGYNDGIAVAMATGGTGTYTYLWDTGDMTEEVTGLSADVTYSVVITDQNGCTDEATIVLSEPTIVEATGNPTDLLCNGDNSGAISLLVSGGNGGYQYDWNQNQYDGMDQLSGLSAGTYEVFVSDAQDCPGGTLSITVEEPAPIDLSVDLSEYQTFNISCNGYTDGSVEVNVDGGGTGPFSVLWDDANASTTAMLEDIGAGTYNAIVTDANGCTNEIGTTLEEPSAIEVQSEQIDVRCSGETNGAIVITSTQGGTGPYEFSLDGSPFGSGVFNGLQADTFELASIDANGCEVLSELIINEPDSVLVDLTSSDSDNEIEFGDSVTLTATPFIGGAPIVSLDWSNNLCPDSLNCNSILVGPQTTTTYRVTVVDENGCSHEDNITLRVRKDRNVYIPNVFAPESSNVGNSVFQIYTGRGVTMIEEFIVVDRWGEIMFRIPNAFDPNAAGPTQWGWDGDLKGKPMNPGVFVYYAKVRFLDGELLEYSGDVTLLR